MSDEAKTNSQEPPQPPKDQTADDDNSPVIMPYVDSEALKKDAEEAEHRKHRRRMSRNHIRRIKRRRRIRRALIAIAVLILALAALGAWFVSSALTAKNEIEAAIASAGQIQSQVASGETSKAKSSIENFSKHIDATYAQTKQPVWKLATFVPYYGSDIKAVRDAVLILENVSNNALPKLADSAEALDFSKIGIQNGTIQLGNMQSAAQNLEAANESVSDANVQLEQIDGTHIPQLTEALSKGKAQFRKLAGLTDTANRMVSVLPKMLGLDSESSSSRTYLVLAQNNSELRATGGIPASWGTLTVENGKLSMGTFSVPPKSTEFSEDEAMAVLTADERSIFSTKMATDYRDINFTPDFPRTGDIASRMWERATGQKVDGVISVDPVFLQSLLKVTGEITLNDGTVLSGENTAQIILNQTYIDKATEAEQDGFFTEAASQVFDHALTNLDGKSSQLVSMFNQAVEDSHIYVWSAHEDEQKRINGTAISGGLSTKPAEPIAGVYFNDGTTSKMDWYLKREITSTYSKTYDSGAKQYTIHIKLTNNADMNQVNVASPLMRGTDQNGNPRHGEIETVMYVYAPAGGRLVDWTQDFDQIAVHNGLTVGVKSIVLEPGESFETTVNVATSPSVGDNEMILRQTPLIQ